MNIANLNGPMETYNVTTTQNVSLEFPIASVADRMVAFLIDVAFLGIYLTFWGLLLFVWLELEPSVWMAPLLIPVSFYHLLCELFLNGQSFGKMIMNIRVFKADGSHLSPGACFIRWIFRLPDITLFSGALATLVIIINGKGQRLGDLAAGTTVLKLVRKNQFDNTLWVDLEEDYQPTFPQASLLTDTDVQTIKEVLLSTTHSNGQAASHARLLQKTRKVITDKTNAQSSLADREFLQTMVKDYNAFHRAN